MLPPPALSLIVPTRRRSAQLRRFLDSLFATAVQPETLEVVLVVDADDPPSVDFRDERLRLAKAIVPPRQTMGALNQAGYERSSGAHLMLLNDDVVIRTHGWDQKILSRCRRFADGIFLIHVNDTLMRENLCTFPLVSRTWCKMAGGICPREYIRYRIDDHIEDVFNLLASLGHRRTIYLPDVVFEHVNFVQMPSGVKEYHSEPDMLALDAPRFLDLFAARKELALSLLSRIEGEVRPEHRRLLDSISDPFALRVPSRLRVETDVPLYRRFLRFVVRTWEQGRACYHHKGAGGLARALRRRVGGLLSRCTSLRCE
jgi:hypothetical protein